MNGQIIAEITFVQFYLDYYFTTKLKFWFTVEKIKQNLFGFHIKYAYTWITNTTNTESTL